MPQDAARMRPNQYRVIERIDDRGLDNIVEIDGVKYISHDAGRRILGVPVTRLGTPARPISSGKGGKPAAA